MLPEISANPINHFGIWFDEAAADEKILDHTAMSVATVTETGAPANRILLLKGFDERGFKFFTNYNSRKGREVAINPNVSLNFYWDALGRQVRIEGFVEKLTAEESDAYFSSRPRESQLSAWPSNQSELLDSYDVFESRLLENTKKFEGKEVTRPPHWGGYLLVPNMIEFWQQVNFRRHYRVQFKRKNVTESWQGCLLFP